ARPLSAGADDAVRGGSARAGRSIVLPERGMLSCRALASRQYRIRQGRSRRRASRPPRKSPRCEPRQVLEARVELFPFESREDFGRVVALQGSAPFLRLGAGAIPEQG